MRNFSKQFFIGRLLRWNKALIILTSWKSCNFNFTSVSKKYSLSWIDKKIFFVHVCLKYTVGILLLKFVLIPLLSILNKCHNLFPCYCYWLLTNEFALRTWYCSWKNHLVFFKSSHSKEFFNIRSVISFYAKALKRFPKKYFRGYCEFGFHWSNYILSKFW